MRTCSRVSRGLAALAILAPTAALAASNKPDPVYSVIYKSLTHLEATCETVVCWDVTSPSSQAISNFTMEVAGCDVVAASLTHGNGSTSTWTGAGLDRMFSSNHQPCGAPGIKFDTGFNDGETKTVCLTYAGMLPLASDNNTGFVIKAGNACIPEIVAAGPACGQTASCRGDGCGEGTWTCGEAGAVCVSDEPLNACGGCEELEHNLGDPCVIDGCTRGQWDCDERDGFEGKLTCEASEVQCDWLDSECLSYACVEGTCQPTQHHEVCDGFDGDFCNGGPICGHKGSCEDSAPVTCQDNDSFCDGSPACVPSTGRCDDVTPACADGEFCSEDEDRCSVCEDFDENDCDGCGPLTSDPGTSCGDACNPGSYVCTQDDVECVTTPIVCEVGVCLHGTCVECTDDTHCTDGVCVQNTCVECAKKEDCDDGEACTSEVCVGNVCDSTWTCEDEEEDECVDLGALASFNVLVCGDYSGALHVEGALAVQGDFTATAFGVGNRLASGQTALVVGGSYTLSNGQVYGDAFYGVSENIGNDVGFLGTRTRGAPEGFSFAEACHTGSKASDKLAGLAANGTTTVHGWGGLELSGNKAGLNVFAVNGGDVSATNTFSVSAPAGSTVVVNVSGESVDLRFAGMSLSGVSMHNVVWNLFEATTVRIEGITVAGSVLAPNAAVSFDNGNVDGSLIAKSVVGYGEFHHVLFMGEVCLPTDEDGGDGDEGDEGEAGARLSDEPEPTEPEPQAAPAADEPPAAPAGCGATPSFEVYNSWGSGFQARVKLSGLATATAGWTVSLDVSPSLGWVGGWWGRYSVSGSTVTATDEGWNGHVGAGGTIEFHLQGPMNGVAPTASNFKLNGVACAP